jgi:Zn-dependent protease with chaperone function
MNLTREFYGLALPIGILSIPVWSMLFRYFTLRGTDEQRIHIWLKFLGAMHVLFLSTLVVWCTLWDVHAALGAPWIFFWLVPVTNTILFQAIARVTNRAILQRRWTTADLLRQTWWGTVHPTVTLLMIATAFDGIVERRLFSVLWLVAAGGVALVGTMRLRSAQGMKPRKVKSGTLYVRATYLAKQLGVKIERICVVPPGRGNLTNAFNSSRTIALTDNFGEYLHGPQLDYVIGHELAHAKNRHTRKELGGFVALYFFLALFAFILGPLMPRYQPLLVLLALALPFLAYYAISRKFEYEADRDAVRLTGDPEAAVRALAALYVKTGAPVERNKFLELFRTHPNLLNRVSAIAHAGQIPQARVEEILFASGILERDSQSQTSAAEG